MIDGKTMKYLRELNKSNYVISSLKSEESELWTRRLRVTELFINGGLGLESARDLGLTSGDWGFNKLITCGSHGTKSG